MPKSKSLIYQVQETLKQKLRIGEQKHFARQQGIASDGIYSWSTHNTYTIILLISSKQILSALTTYMKKHILFIVYI